MSWLKTGLKELFGLIVDDGHFALAIVIWLLVMWLAASWLAPIADWTGALFFAGLAVILVESALRRAGR